VYWGRKSFSIFTHAILAGGVFVVAASISYRSVPWVVRRIRPRKKKVD
jgi:hypothetical protein